MLRLSSLLRAAVPMVYGAGSSDLSTSASGVHKDRTVPVVINSSFGTGERTPLALSFQEEERRVARQKKLFEDMVVFEGGCLADHETYGKEMITRDFIHYALYHYKWGYYPKMQRKYRDVLMNSYFEPIPYSSLRSEHDYQLYVGRLVDSSPTFPTPSQIFQPYYGWVLAEYMITIMRAKFDPCEPLVIYDVGAGTGLLAQNILDFLAEHYPNLYDTCEYHLLDLSPYMIPIQRRHLIHHYSHAKIHHVSIHNWRELEARRCFVLAVDVLSSMPHDIVVTAKDGTAFEEWIQFDEVDNLASLKQDWRQVSDPIILRYLRYAEWMHEESFHALRVLCLTDGQQNIDPPIFKSLIPVMYDTIPMIAQKILYTINPACATYIPTAQMLFLEVLAQYFPRHHAFFMDCNQVIHDIGGRNAPVCQIKIRAAKDIYLRRVQDRLMENAGMVDVCFPTDFEILKTVYKNVCGPHKEISCMKHTDFWKTFGGDKTSVFTTASGFNPLLEDYKLFNVFSTNHPAEM